MLYAHPLVDKALEHFLQQYINGTLPPEVAAALEARFVQTLSSTWTIPEKMKESLYAKLHAHAEEVLASTDLREYAEERVQRAIKIFDLDNHFYQAMQHRFSSILASLADEAIAKSAKKREQREKRTKKAEKTG